MTAKCQLFKEFEEAIDSLVVSMTIDARAVRPEDLDLDPRVATALYVQNGCIIANKRDDDNLQYYGGFEYVEKEHRLTLGHYVIYSSDSHRVRDHVANLETEH
jgi:hypothetical protein